MFEDYPYNPALRTADVVYAEGLDKLRYVENRDWAQSLYNLWQAIHNPRHVSRTSKVEEERKREEMVDLAKRAHDGKLGAEERELAFDIWGERFISASNHELGRFWRGYTAMRQARANRVTGEV